MNRQPQRARAAPRAPLDLFDDAAPLPDGLVYQREFLGVDDEAALLAHLATLPFEAARYKDYTARRRVVSYGSRYDFGDNALLDAPPVPDVPAAAARARRRLDRRRARRSFADALVAEYAPARRSAGTATCPISSAWSACRWPARAACASARTRRARTSARACSH